MSNAINKNIKAKKLELINFPIKIYILQLLILPNLFTIGFIKQKLILMLVSIMLDSVKHNPQGFFC